MPRLVRLAGREPRLKKELPYAQRTFHGEELHKMAFLSLYPDIYAQIIFYVPSIRDLAALSQSCRALHSLCDMKTRERFYRIRVYHNDTSINETLVC
jgi:hypothetical protein